MIATETDDSDRGERGVVGAGRLVVLVSAALLLGFGLASAGCSFDTTVGEGACNQEGENRSGYVCRGGEWVVVDGGNPSSGIDTGGGGECVESQEVCNGKDDDCDSVVDESCPCDYKGHVRGVCAGGVRQEKTGRCRAPSAYVVDEGADDCDGKDNDCDGRIDENCSCDPGETQSCYGGPSGTAGTGQCKSGMQTCTSKGRWDKCEGEVGPSEEKCGDQIDSDCNGAASNGCPCNYSGKQHGLCKDLERTAKGVCPKPATYESPSASESHCDQLDNDCDGNVDEGCGCRYKGKTTGVCTGLRRDARGACPRPATFMTSTNDESPNCDSRDNDCDGTTDEGCSGCTSGQSRSCYTGRSGSAGTGICQKGTESCTNGTWGACQGEVTPKANDICGDSKDNDCDGMTDENCGCRSGNTQSCYTGKAGTKGVGICTAGTKTCQSDGTWGSCTGQTTPTSEVCGDGTDTDCDGMTDESCGCNYMGKTQGVCTGQPSTGSTCQKPAAYEPTETTCNDQLDNDCDGKTDFKDSNCKKTAGATCSKNEECRFTCASSAQKCAHRVFVSSKTYSGNLGGLSGADQACNSLASRAGLSGNWRAIMSDSSTDAKGRITVKAPVGLLDKHKVADTANDLWDQSIDTSIDMTEKQTTVSRRVWTGTNPDGTRDGANDIGNGQDCSNWTSSQWVDTGEAGNSKRSDSRWLLYNTSDPRCSNKNSIYCIDGQ